MSSQSPADALRAEDLRRRIQSETSVFLYGAGTMGRDSLKVIQGMGGMVEAFLDAQELHFSEIEGVPVLRPNDVGLSLQKRRETTVIVTIFNPYVDATVVHRRLSELGWAKVISFMAFYEACARELGNRYWLTSRDYYQALSNRIEAVRALWADQKSREVFDGIMHFRRTGDYSALKDPDVHSQYFPDDLPKWETPLRFVDCGAYDGDTLRRIRNLTLHLEAYAGFEPDINNFNKLSDEVLSAGVGAPAEVSLWPCGAWSHACQLRFASGQGSGSAVRENGDMFIQCVALDDVLPYFSPTLIKMDIEGAEFPALRGAARTIKTRRPGLAICLYHEPSHLWQIPLLLASWSLNYRFYLRSHCYSGFDLVLYAIPA